MVDMENEVVVNEVAENEVAETKATRDPLSKYHELDTEKQSTVESIVSDVLDKLGGVDNIDLPLLLGVLDRLNAEKKTAKEADKQKAKERKEAEKQIKEAQGELLKKTIQINDTIDYYMSTSKVTILQATVVKVTEKSARIEITADSLVLYKGKEMKAGDVSGLKLGFKSAPFAKITNLKRNGESVEIAA